MTSDVPHHQAEAPPSSGATPIAEPSELQRMRAERDAALEELAFLREQLRSTEAFYAHRFELEYARLYAEHRGFLQELSQLSADFHRRSRRDDAMREDTRPAPSEPDGTPTLPRPR